MLIERPRPPLNTPRLSLSRLPGESTGQHCKYLPTICLYSSADMGTHRQSRPSTIPPSLSSSAAFSSLLFLYKQRMKARSRQDKQNAEGKQSKSCLLSLNTCHAHGWTISAHTLTQTVHCERSSCTTCTLHLFTSWGLIYFLWFGPLKVSNVPLNKLLLYNYILYYNLSWSKKNRLF